MFGTKSNYPQITKSIIYKLGIEITKKLNKSQDKLERITWNVCESNLDTEYSKLACDCCIIVWNEMKLKYPEYSKIEITCEIPDINITFEYPDGTKSRHKIELKSSKSKKMPGSTIKNLDINQTLIYCLRPSIASEPFKLKCSQYYNAMGESNTDLFQDRTPRPIINFDKMNEEIPFVTKDKNDWIEHYAKCALKRIEETTICQKSWQDTMIKILKKEIVNDYIKNTTEQQFQIDKNSLKMNST